MSKNPYDIVTILNLSDQPWPVIHSGQIFYTIEPGQKLAMARFLAELSGAKLITHLIMTKDGRGDYKNSALRSKWAKQIYLHEQTFQPQPVLSLEQQRLKQVDEQIKSDLELLEEEREQEEVTTPPSETLPPLNVPQAPVVEQEPPVNEGLKTEPLEPEQKTLPTREELYLHGQKELGMTLDEKTKKALDDMDVERLMEVLQWDK